MAEHKLVEEQVTVKRYTREELVTFFTEIGASLVQTDPAPLQALIALNNVLASPDIRKVMDDDLTEQAKDLWAKLKSTGVQISNPPLLFGYPEIDTTPLVYPDEQAVEAPSTASTEVTSS